MGWFKQLCWSLITLSAAAACVSCQELTSTLREGNLTCPGEVVIFTCTLRGSSGLSGFVLAWSSTEYIGQDGSLQLSTANALGHVETSTSMDGSLTATATVTNNTIDNGVRVLESTLRITADVASMVTCSGTSGGTESIDFSISAIPEAPQNVRAAETTQPLANNICIILVTWVPPANIDQSDIDHYTVYVSSGSASKETTAIAILRVPNCRSNDIGIQITTVTRFGCVGQNSTKVRPTLLITNTQTAVTIDHSDALNITPESVGEPGIPASVIAAILVVCILFLASVTILIIVLLLFFIKGSRRKDYQEMEKREEDIKREIQLSLKDLYTALKMQTHDQESVQESVKCLSNSLKKRSASLNTVRKALKNTVKTIKREEGEEFRRALDKLMNSVDISSISGGMKIIVETLHTAAGTDHHDEAIEELINVLMGWAKSDDIKGCLQKLCEKLLEDESQKRLQKFCDNDESKLNITETSYLDAEA